MSQKFCAENKKKIFTAFFGVVFFAAIFWLIQPAPKAEAASCSSGCDTSAGVCVWDYGMAWNNFLQGRQTCSVNAPYQDTWDWGGGWSTSCISGSGPATNKCQTDTCPSLNDANGSPCTIVTPTGTLGINCSSLNSLGKWDASKSKCIACSGNKELSVCGTTESITVDTNTGACIGAGDGKFKSACGASAACEGQSEGCVGAAGFCNSGGAYTPCSSGFTCSGSACVPVSSGSLTVVANPNTITQNTPTNVEFTVTSGGSNISGANVSISGAGTSGSCGPTSTFGKCTISNIKATSTGTATATASKTPTYTNGTTTITVQPAGSLIVTASPSSIPASTPTSVTFMVKGGGVPASGIKVTLTGGYSGNCNTGGGFCSIPNISATSNINVTAHDPLGTFSDGTTTITVSAAGCTPGTCSGTQWCPVAGGPWQNCPVVGQSCVGGVCTGGGSVSINSCNSCNPAGNGPCNNISGNPLWTTANAPTNAASCAADANVSNICSQESAGGFAGCRIGLSNGTTCSCGSAGTTVSFGGNNCYQLTGTSVPATVNYNGATVGPNDTIILRKPDNSVSSCMQVTGTSGTNNYNLDVSGTWRVEIDTGSSCLTPGPVKATARTTVQSTSCSGAVTPSAGPCASGTTNYRSPLSYCSIQDLIKGATGWVLGLVSSIVILFLVYGGIMYTMAAGDETKMESAKNIIYYAILGLAIILVSYTLITEVKTILKVK